MFLVQEIGVYKVDHLILDHQALLKVLQQLVVDMVLGSLVVVLVVLVVDVQILFINQVLPQVLEMLVDLLRLKEILELHLFLLVDLVAVAAAAQVVGEVLILMVGRELLAL